MLIRNVERTPREKPKTLETPRGMPLPSLYYGESHAMVYISSIIYVLDRVLLTLRDFMNACMHL